MGLDANVVCIGKFSGEIVSSLEYVPEAYEDTMPGMIVVTTLFNCNNSDQSRQLAKALGAEEWDFNTHYITEDKVDWSALYELAAESAGWDEDVVNQFGQLLSNGFICMYQPNG